MQGRVMRPAFFICYTIPMIDTDLDARLKTMEKQMNEMHDVVMHMRRAQIVARNRKILYWLVIIILSLIAYYSIKPYLQQLQSLTDTTSDYGDLIKTLNE